MNNPPYPQSSHTAPFISRQVSTGLSQNASPHPGVSLPNGVTLTAQQQAMLQQAHLVQQQQKHLMQQQHQASNSTQHPPAAQQVQNQHRIAQQHQQQAKMYQQQQHQQQLLLQQQKHSQLPPQVNPSPSLNPSNKRPMPPHNEIIGPNQALTRAKRFKPTDRTLPSFDPPPIASEMSDPTGPVERAALISKLAADYARLQKTEHKIDWTISRKRLELEDALKKSLSVKRTMRVKIWNTVQGQSWQRPTAPSTARSAVDEAEPNTNADAAVEENPDQPVKTVAEDLNEVDFATGEGVPKWTLHIQGRLLDHVVPPLTVEGTTPPVIIETTRPFSSLITGLLIRVDRPNDLYPEPNFVEWQRRPTLTPTSSTAQPASSNPTFSKFTLTRSGSEKCRVQLALHLDHHPQRVKLMPILGDFLDLQEASLGEIIDALWAYIKKERLQDSSDKRSIKKDEKLACLFPPSCDRMPFHQLSESIRRFIGMAEPVTIDFEVNVEEGCEDKVKCYDIEFNIEDPAKLHMLQVKEALDGNDQTSKEISQLDEQISESIVKLKEVKTRRDFYAQFANDPITFLKTWLTSQARDLDTLFGTERGSEASSVNLSAQKTAISNGTLVGGEDQKRYSEFYHQSWVEEGVRLYESREFNEKVARATAPPPSMNNHHPPSHNGVVGHPAGTMNGLMGPNGVNLGPNNVHHMTPLYPGAPIRR